MNNQTFADMLLLSHPHFVLKRGRERELQKPNVGLTRRLPSSTHKCYMYNILSANGGDDDDVGRRQSVVTGLDVTDAALRSPYARCRDRSSFNKPCQTYAYVSCGTQVCIVYIYYTYRDRIELDKLA